MASAEIDIEWIVGEVVRRLCAIDTSSANGRLTPPAAQTVAGELQLEERLVTLDTLHDRLAGIQSVVVAPRAIVTPAVVDELKDRGVTLSRGQRSELHSGTELSHAGAPGRSDRPCVCVSVDGVDVDSLRRQCGVRVTVVESRGPQKTHKVVSAAINQGHPAVLITQAPSAAVVAANRNANVRAAVGFNFPAVRQAVDDADANLLAIDPRGKSTAQLFGLINEFLNRN